MNAGDLALQRSFPTVMVPRREPVAPMAAAGERLLIGENGVFIEIDLPWLSVVRRVAHYSVPTAIPYGQVVESTVLRCGSVPPHLIGEFVEMARAARPLEAGAWVVWNVQTQQFRLAPVKVLAQGTASLKYERPALSPDELRVMDCHSHGAHPAYFSSTDNEDDRHETKLAFVVGNCASPVPSMAMRLCAKGIFEDVERVPSSWYAAARLKEIA
ncbi:PRTRC system protein A [Caballeronia sp. LZ035]|uniref:PRTRC system protein A n=1 Tax=Caballeronia sp. LZ035 TaxID=3038568 RepID=UPI002866797B|nr:PRTRC system protein A [Caballeronia sp. LZ035]MDR5762970.1 PRTRC system protein A [Caballeronia sp. LZ035]